MLTINRVKPSKFEVRDENGRSFFETNNFEEARKFIADKNKEEYSENYHPGNITLFGKETALYHRKTMDKKRNLTRRKT